MTDSAAELITADAIKQLLSEVGYEITSGDEDIFHVRDLESGLRVTCVLQDNVLFNTLPCFSTSADNISLEMTKKLLDADNGIHTSHFQLYSMPDGQVRVALTNFCKLQDLGHEDQDDILSCVTFLLVDVVEARTLLAEFL